MEAVNSSLMGFFEKRKFKFFLEFLAKYDKTQPSTYHKGKSLDKVIDYSTATTTADVYYKYIYKYIYMYDSFRGLHSFYLYIYLLNCITIAVY